MSWLFDLYQYAKCHEKYQLAECFDEDVSRQSVSRMFRLYFLLKNGHNFVKKIPSELQSKHLDSDRHWWKFKSERVLFWWLGCPVNKTGACEIKRRHSRNRSITRPDPAEKSAMKITPKNKVPMKSTKETQCRVVNAEYWNSLNWTMEFSPNEIQWIKRIQRIW